MSSSTSDSDACERARNVHSVLIKSESGRQNTEENCTYKQKLGDLIFDASFEAGNLGFVDHVDEFEYDLMVRPDVTNPRYRLWFNFTVTNQRPNQCVIFTFVNLSSHSRIFRTGLTPVVRSRLNPNWVRLHEDQVFYYRSPNHGNIFVLSLAVRFSSYDNKHQFALFYPYSFTTLTSFINRWEVELKRQECSKAMILTRCHADSKRRSPELRSSSRQSNSTENDRLRTTSSQGFSATSTNLKQPGEDLVFVAHSVGTSILMRSIYMLSVKGEKNSSKSLVVIFCRSGGNIDGVCSFACQGLIDYILSNNLGARVARQYVEFLIFPLIDPDSVCAGNTRTDIMGQSKVTMKLVKNNKSIYDSYRLAYEQVERKIKENCSRTIVIELRVNLSLIGSRIVGDYYEDNLRMERYLALPRLLARFSDNFYLEQCIFNKNFTSRLSFFYFPSASADHYRLELSPFAFYKRSLLENTYEEYDQRRYLAIGKTLVYSLVELLRNKDKSLPHCFAVALADFHPKATDIDELTLNSKQKRSRQSK